MFNIMVYMLLLLIFLSVHKHSCFKSVTMTFCLTVRTHFLQTVFVVAVKTYINGLLYSTTAGKNNEKTIIIF